MSIKTIERHEIKAITERLRGIEIRLTALESGKSEPLPETRIMQNDDVLVKNIDKVGIQDLVTLSLKLRGEQSKEQIKNHIKELGKEHRDWFNGGNFNNRLIKKGVVKIEKTDSGEDVYSLTRKGLLVAEEKLAELVRE